MKPRSILTISPWILLPLRGIRGVSLLAVILIVGCAPVVAPSPAEPEASVQEAAPATELPVPTPTQSQPLVIATDVLPTVEPVEPPQPVATSRGPNLEAIDPATVSLASGDLQLVEFFRFT
jgi:hypothetical protein